MEKEEMVTRRFELLEEMYAKEMQRRIAAERELRRWHPDNNGIIKRKHAEVSLSLDGIYPQSEVADAVLKRIKVSRRGGRRAGHCRCGPWSIALLAPFTRGTLSRRSLTQALAPGFCRRENGSPRMNNTSGGCTCGEACCGTQGSPPAGRRRLGSGTSPSAQQ